MVMPVFGKGKLAGKPIFDVQGLGISTNAEGSGGRRGLPRISAIAGAAEGVLGRDRLDSLQHHLRHLRHQGRSRARRCGSAGDWARTSRMSPIWCRASSTSRRCSRPASRSSQGKITGEQAGELAAQVAKEWRDFNPDMVENYKKWAADLSAAELTTLEAGPSCIGPVPDLHSRLRWRGHDRGMAMHSSSRLTPYLYVAPLVALLAVRLRLSAGPHLRVQLQDGPRHRRAVDRLSQLRAGAVARRCSGSRCCTICSCCSPSPSWSADLAADLDPALRAGRAAGSSTASSCSCPSCWRFRSSPWS